MREVYSKLIIMKPEWRQLRRSDVFFVNFQQISGIALFPVFTLNKQMPAW